MMQFTLFDALGSAPLPATGEMKIGEELGAIVKAAARKAVDVTTTSTVALMTADEVRMGGLGECPAADADRGCSERVHGHSAADVDDGDRGKAPGGAAASNDLSGTSAAGDNLLDALVLASEISPTFAQRHLAGFLAGKRRNCEPLARQGGSYAERVILAEAEIPFEVFVQDAGVRAMLARFASRFDLVDFQCGESGAAGGGNTLVTFCERQLDEMERKGVLVLRMHAGRTLPSTQWWADHMGVLRSIISKNGQLRDRLQRRLKAGTLKLGGVFIDPIKLTRAERRAVRAPVKAVLLRHLAEHRPIASHPERADKIWFDQLFDEAGVMDPHHRDILEFDKELRTDLTRVLDAVGLAPLGTEAARGVEVTYAILREREGDAVGLIRERYRREHPDEEPASTREDRYVANELAYLNRFARENGRAPEDGVKRDFGDGFEDRLRLGHTSSVKGNGIYDDSIERWRAVAASLARAGVFPATFFGAFATAMHVRQMDAGTLADGIKAPRRLIYSWRGGRCMPTITTEHFVIAAEGFLDVPPGTFTSRLGDLATGTPNRGRSHLTLANGRSIQLSYWWRRLPEGAAAWPDDKLLPMLEEAVERHERQATVGGVRIGAAQRNIFGLPEEDPACPFWTEWEDLVRFKRGLSGDERVQLADDNWNTTATIKANRTYASIFERWCRLPSSAGGLGLFAAQVSFRLLLNPSVAKRYLVWRAVRCAHLELNGEPIGIQITSTEKAIAGFFSGLLEGDFGWLTQSEKQLGLPAPINIQFRLPGLSVTDGEVQIVDDDACPMVEVMPADIVQRAASDWRSVVAEARKQARVLKSNFALKFKLIRDPKDLIGPIVRHAHPMAVLLRMIREALKRVRPVETSPLRHARDYQRIVAALLLALVVFRSETLRNLTWRKDNTGQLRWVEPRTEIQIDGSSMVLEGYYEVVVDADNFKNVTSTILFGPSWNRRPYERELRDWGGLHGILKHFIEVCRPILLDGRESDLLLPPPKPQRESTRDKTTWSDADFNFLINSFTGMWCVYNRRFGTGMIGVRSFGPHPFRDIIASHILRHWKGEDRWELAARVLGTGIQQVRDRYGWIDTRAELGKVDPLFDEASRLAMSDLPLW